MRFLVRVLLPAIAVIAIVVFALNTSRLAPAAESTPLLIAHRGLGQNFWREGIGNDTCTAERMLAPEHPYLENTIDGIAASFEAGADIVEFDIQPTTDGHFVVFHDWTLDCRTNGTGVTREHTLAELKALDIGYGYTADEGETYPFRGQPPGLMPTLEEVLDAFPDRRFLINIKSDDPAEGQMLADALLQRPEAERDLIMVYGGGRALAAFEAELPGLTTLSTDNVRRCLINYELSGWIGIVPETCHNSLFMVPVNYTRFVWGFPQRLAERLRGVGSILVVLGVDDGSGFSTSIDDLETLAMLPDHFDGAIWTNRIDLIGPAVLNR